MDFDNRYIHYMEKKLRNLIKYDAGMLGAKNNDSRLKKWVIVKFYTQKYPKCGKSD